MEWLLGLGFDVVEYRLVDEDNIEAAVAEFSEKIIHNDFPSDGLVLTYDDIAYSKTLGTTAKFPRDAIAFKWADEVRETTLLDWNGVRQGQALSIRLLFLSLLSLRGHLYQGQVSII